MKAITFTTIVAILPACLLLSYQFELFNSNNLKSEQSVPEYNKEISKKYGAYSKIAYCPQDKVKNWTCKDCQAYSKIQNLKIIYNSKRDIFGYAFYDLQLNKIILTWRGSIDFKNIENDFTYAKIPYTCTFCEIHLGFHEAFKVVQKQVFDVIQQLLNKYPKAKMTVTGHSLGAALSTISAIELNKHHPKLVDQIHNFGCPRVGNERLAEYIKNEIPTLFRVVHNHDIFTHLPQIEQRYYHYPYQVLYDQGMNNYQICDNSGQDPTCSNSYSPNYNKKDHTFYFFPMDQTNC